MVTDKANRFLHATNNGISSKDIGQSRKFQIRNPISKETFPTKLKAQRLSPLNIAGHGEFDVESDDPFQREQKEEQADLDHIQRTNPKLFREIQLREGAFDDRMSIEEIEDELRKLGKNPGDFTNFTDKNPVLPKQRRNN